VLAGFLAEPDEDFFDVDEVLFLAVDEPEPVESEWDAEDEPDEDEPDDPEEEELEGDGAFVSE
jgi:hypothetical protein